MMSPSSRVRFLGTAAALLIAAEAHADGISLSEQPSHVTEAVIVVDASPTQIYALVTDYANWPQFLSDIKSVKVEAGGRRDAKVRFRSTALEHEVAVKFDNLENREIRFHSVDAPPGAHASGTYVLEPIDNGMRTRITARFYMDVVGIAGIFVRSKTLRAMRQNKLRADLSDVAARFVSRPQAAAR